MRDVLATHAGGTDDDAARRPQEACDTLGKVLLLL